jgi:hypothetical protein
VNKLAATSVAYDVEGYAFIQPFLEGDTPKGLFQ